MVEFSKYKFYKLLGGVILIKVTPSVTFSNVTPSVTFSNVTPLNIFF